MYNKLVYLLNNNVQQTHAGTCVGTYVVAIFYLQMQGAYLVADDIIDHSLTRRGKPCWYKQVQ